MMPGKTSARYSCDVLPGQRFENINVLTRKAAEYLRDNEADELVWVNVYVDLPDMARLNVGQLPYVCGKGPTGWYATPIWKSDRVEDFSFELRFEDRPIARLTTVTPANVVHALRTAVSMGALPLQKGEVGIVRAFIGMPGQMRWFHDYAVKVGRWAGEVTVDYRWDSRIHYKGARM